MSAAAAPASQARLRPIEMVAIALILTLHASLVWLLRSPAVVTASDPAWYILLARSLQDFVYQNPQFAELGAHTKYPPAYPALLAMLGVTSLERFDVAVLANVVLSAAALALTYAAVRRLSPAVALLSLVATSVNPLLLTTAGSVLSEPLYMVLVAAAVYAMTRDTRSSRSRLLVIVALVLATLTRSAGVSAILATLLLWSIGREWRSVVQLGTAATICVGGWLMWSAVATPARLPGQSYFADALYPGRSVAAAAPAAADGDSTSVSPAPPVPPRLPAPISGALAFDDSMLSLRDASTAAPRATPASAQAAGGGGHASLATRDLSQTDAQRAATPAPSLPGTLIRRILSNGRTIAARLIPAALSLPVRATSRVDAAVWLLFAVTLASAGALVMWSRTPALLITSAAALALLLLWPYLLIRYLAPLVPAMVVVLVAGAHAIGRRLGSRDVRRDGWRDGWRALAAPAAVACVLTAAAATSLYRRTTAVMACDRATAASSLACVTADQRDYFAVAAAVRTLPDDGANFLVSQEASFHLLTGRYSAWEAEASTLREPAELREYLRQQRVGYVVLSRTNLNQWSLVRPLKGMCQHLGVMRRFGGRSALLRFSPDSLFTPDGCDVVATWGKPPWPDAPGLLW